ncbi:hypothetical protein HKX48_002988, partial [Thoreauomyces humboldtii]
MGNPVDGALFTFGVCFVAYRLYRALSNLCLFVASVVSTPAPTPAPIVVSFWVSVPSFASPSIPFDHTLHRVDSIEVAAACPRVHHLREAIAAKWGNVDLVGITIYRRSAEVLDA